MSIPAEGQQGRPLTGPERRALRRIEDAAIVDDPLLELRLGEARGGLRQALSHARRRSRVFAGRVSKRSLVALIVTTTCTATLTLVIVLSLPVAFAIAYPLAFMGGAWAGWCAAPEQAHPDPWSSKRTKRV